MKKNFMMRAASVLLVAVMLTTCAISGTFAKYITADDASDFARVAKWGVTVSVEGTAFAEKYEIKTATDDKAGAPIEYSVKSANGTDKVLAPGTSGTFTGVAVAGTPEVAVNVATVATVTINGWMIDDDKDALTPEVFYCPIVITINGNDIDGKTYNNAGDLQTAIKNAIELANGNYQANTNLASVANLNGSYSWVWDFDDAGAGTYDVEDTILGDMVANGGTATIEIEVTTTVTQID